MSEMTYEFSEGHRNASDWGRGADVTSAGGSAGVTSSSASWSITRRSLASREARVNRQALRFKAGLRNLRGTAVRLEHNDDVVSLVSEKSGKLLSDELDE